MAAKTMNSVNINKICLLESEIEILQRRAENERYGGMGHLFTTIEVLKHRLLELKNEE